MFPPTQSVLKGGIGGAIEPNTHGELQNEPQADGLSPMTLLTGSRGRRSPLADRPPPMTLPTGRRG
eukprot:5405292-Alexandrium_andersonii.AAC.1